MTKEEAKLIVLEHLLDEAAKTIEFMHLCLTTEGYTYAYPDMASDDVRAIRRLVPERPACAHGVYKPDCEACKQHMSRYHYLIRAKKVLSEGECGIKSA